MTLQKMTTSIAKRYQLTRRWRNSIQGPVFIGRQFSSDHRELAATSSREELWPAILTSTKPLCHVSQYLLTLNHIEYFFLTNFKLLNKFLDTSRPPRLGEINGKEYHFTSREKMEEDIQAGKFIEYGEYKGNLYGTNTESVSSLVDAGYVCLLNPHYQALKMLRSPKLKPYVIYIKPPRFEILKETRNEARARSTFDENNSRGFTVS